MSTKDIVWAALLMCFSLPAIAQENQTQEFCLDGEVDLGLRQQGFTYKAGEFYPLRWCVTYETLGNRVQFANAGNINADARDVFSVRYLNSDAIQIMDDNNQPVVAFVGAIVGAEASALRRMDPDWLLAEIERNPDYIVTAGKNTYLLRYPGSGYPVKVKTQNKQVVEVITKADFPLHGTAEVLWRWDRTTSSESPLVTLFLNGKPLFKAQSSRKVFTPQQAHAFWATSESNDIREIPGKAWPSRVNMQVTTLSPGIHIVNGVRTGFHHLVVETRAGLVVVDAPAGWVEVQQIPPMDLAPGLGTSGLSELFVNFLARHFPNKPFSAVILTHFHDDHAGGARAFSAAGADVWAPAGDVDYLNQRFNLASLPADRLGASQKLHVNGLTAHQHFGEGQQRLEIKSLTGNPHVQNAVAVWLPHNKLLYHSDIKVPHSAEAESNDEQKARYCWFANWAAKQLPQEYEVMHNHSHHRITSDVVQAFAATNQCQE